MHNKREAECVETGTHSSSLSLCCTIHAANVYRIPFMLPSGRPRGRVAGFPWPWQEAGGGAKNSGWGIRWPGCFFSALSYQLSCLNLGLLTKYLICLQSSMTGKWKSREIGKFEYYKKKFFFFKLWDTGQLFWDLGVWGIRLTANRGSSVLHHPGLPAFWMKVEWTRQQVLLSLQPQNVSTELITS